MIQSLTISNLALIESNATTFGKGFTAITGETGSGKSVFMSALRLVCGAKASAAQVRIGAEKAVVEAVFDLQGLERVKEILLRLAVDSDDEMVIQREVLATGKSRARINGTLVGQNDLQEIGEWLVQMHGQSEQVLLRDVRMHQEMLDAFGGFEPLLREVRQNYQAWNQAVQAQKDLKERATGLAQQKEFLQFQFQELDKAQLLPNEEADLEAQASAAAENETRVKVIRDSLEMLDGERGILDRCSVLESKLRTAYSKQPSLEAIHASIDSALEVLRESARTLHGMSRRTASDEIDVDQINSRLALIQKLKRKYRTDHAGLFALHAQRKEELAAVENLDADLELLARKEMESRARLDQVCAQLTESRTQAAARLDSKVESRLHSLGMPKARFVTKLEPIAPTANGAERVEFHLAPNAGEGLKPLKQAVSGGELSRVMLAFKSVMAGQDQVPVLVFDEVDSGISGEVAHSIGQCLQELGASHQVLTITHLHQVASKAHHHIGVAKFEEEGRTHTEVRSLTQDARIVEIARMLGGSSATVTAHAKQLLEESHALH